MSLSLHDHLAGNKKKMIAILTARQAALPTEHGSWVFLLVPLVIGLAAGGLAPQSGLLAGTALAAFLARQPVTLLVKALSGRRPKSDIQPGLFWLAVYGMIAVTGAIGLAGAGYAFVFWLAAPAIPVLGWHLWLVSRRAERKQALVEIAGSGALSLGVTAAYWIGVGHYEPTGWLLWGLCWAQAAGTILYAYLRLEQRRWKTTPTLQEGFLKASRPLMYNFTLMGVTIGLAAFDFVPTWLPLAYAIQPLETAWGTVHPAVGVKPAVVGIRQMIVSILFAVVFLLAWRAG